MHPLLNNLPPEVLLWGGTGAAKQARPIIEHCGSRVAAVFDDTPGLVSPFADVPIYCGWDAFQHWLAGRDRKKLGFCIAIGNPHGRVRLKFHHRLIDEGLSPATIAHPSAIVEADARIGAGTQILAGAVVDANVTIGRQCIVSLNATVAHDDVLADGTEVGPGATLCGNVELNVNAWIGAGATVLPRIRIGEDVIVGAGAVVTRDIANGLRVAGVPARELVKKASTCRVYE